MKNKLNYAAYITVLLTFLYSVYLFITLGGAWAYVKYNLVMIPFLLFIIYLMYWIFNFIRKNILLFLPILTLASCQYAKSNQQVIVSSDCGQTWEHIKPGEAVPKSALNACFMKVVVPNSNMQGETKFMSNMQGQVHISAEIDYDYNITDALKFIYQAKSLGRANTHADSDDAIDKSFEAAENAVIEIRIKDVAKTIFLKSDITAYDQAEIETMILSKTNEVLLPLGVQLNFITLTIVTDEQTRQAIDAVVAYRIYQNNNMAAVGDNAIVALAGASKITINGAKTDQ